MQETVVDLWGKQHTLFSMFSERYRGSSFIAGGRRIYRGSTDAADLAVVRTSALNQSERRTVARRAGIDLDPRMRNRRACLTGRRASSGR